MHQKLLRLQFCIGSYQAELIPFEEINTKGRSDSLSVHFDKIGYETQLKLFSGEEEFELSISIETDGMSKILLIRDLD